MEGEDAVRADGNIAQRLEALAKDKEALTAELIVAGKMHASDRDGLEAQVSD